MGKAKINVVEKGALSLFGERCLSEPQLYLTFYKMGLKNTQSIQGLERIMPEEQDPKFLYHRG